MPYNSTGKLIPELKYIGKYIKTTGDLQDILDRYYTKCMNDKLKLYDSKIFKLMNTCLESNIQLVNLFKIIIKPRTFTNRFRKNNTLNYLIQLYTIILNMLVNYEIQTTFDLNNYSCFHMLVHVSIFIKSQTHLLKYFEYNGDLIHLLLEIRQHILMIAHAFLKEIYSSYEANYRVMVRNLTNISRSKNLTKTVNLLISNQISSHSLNVSQRNNKKNYDYGINLYIHFLSMYNVIIILIDTFKQYTTSNRNLTTEFIKEIGKMFNEISEKNKLLFKEYIKYLGRDVIGESVKTGYVNNANSLMKGLYHESQIW